MGVSGYNSAAGFQAPAPANSTVVLQEISWSGCYLSCQGPKIPQWNSNNISPSQVLIQSGLTASVLMQEINALNLKSSQFVGNKKNTVHYLGYLSLVIIICGIIASVILSMNAMNYSSNGHNNYFITLIAVCITIVVGGMLNRFARSKHQQLWNECLNSMAAYIQNEVNQKYTSSGISWSVSTKAVIHGSGRGRFSVRYDDYCISPQAQAAVVQIVQQPQVIYVDQNGNKIQPQQQVIVVNQNGVPINNQNQNQRQVVQQPAYAPIGADAPPPYASEGPMTVS